MSKESKNQEPLILVVQGGTKLIAEEFVKTCKAKPVHVLTNDLKAEIGNFNASSGRANKCEKAINRINIITNTICKKTNVTDVAEFESHKTIQNVSQLLVENQLEIAVTQNGKPIRSMLTTQTNTSEKAGAGIW